MKHLKLAFSFLKRNLVPMLLLMGTLTAVLFILLSVWSQYLYTAYTKSFFERNDEMRSSYYCTFSVSEKDARECRQALLADLREMEGFGKAVSYDSIRTEYSMGEYVQISAYLMDDDTLNALPLLVSEGRWLSADSTELEVVLSGEALQNAKIGEKLVLFDGIEARVVGRTENNIVPFFNLVGEADNADLLFENQDVPIFLLNADALPTEYRQQIIASLRTRPGFLLCFDQNATVEQKQSMLGRITEDGGIATSAKYIIQGSNEKIRTWLLESVPMPAFLLVIATISLLSVSAVVVKRSMGEHSKYYLLGCTKTRTMATLSLTLGSNFIIPFLINFILAEYFPTFLRTRTEWELTYAIVNVYSYLPLVVYLLLIGTVFAVMPILFYRKYSPLSFYRRNL